jgi:hypothetical protein
MNIKIKAFLLALLYVASPFLFLYVLFEYPLVILVVGLTAIVYIAYGAVLSQLEKE